MMGVYTMALSGAAAVAGGGGPRRWTTGRAGAGRARSPPGRSTALFACWVGCPGRCAGGPPRSRSRSRSRRWLGGLLRDPLAWQVTGFMGLQSLGFYATLAWLPSVLHQPRVPARVRRSAAVGLHAVSATGLPWWCRPSPVRARDQRWLVVASCVLPARVLAGILLAARLRRLTCGAAARTSGRAPCFRARADARRAAQSDQRGRGAAVREHCTSRSGYLIAAAARCSSGVVTRRGRQLAPRDRPAARRAGSAAADRHRRRPPRHVTAA